MKNRSTIARELAEVVIEAPHVDGKQINMTAEQAVMVSLFRKALTGDVPAVKEVQDTLYGKMADNINIESPKGTMSPPLNRLAEFVSRKKPDAE